MPKLMDLMNTVLAKRRKSLEEKAKRTGKNQQGGMVDTIYASARDRDSAIKQLMGE